MGNKILKEIRPKAIVVVSSHWETMDEIRGMMVHNLHDSVNRETKAVLQEVLPYTIPFERNLDKIVIDSKVPIHVAAGAAGQDQGKKIYESFFGGLSWGSVEFCDGG
ncbi:hypothetical protein C2G38_2240858 [Gigaspora rosea]|uniref:Extradiol ring-cleavage dioxygenase class III enzyme subunit B domain-containing protein n=1 Tax=Gigaspora rosea TaxID=44941 RepID=A0A397VZ37_9GLOM|nr:hypothetical protein C2G38_2240858 [Gigaspora rosea]